MFAGGGEAIREDNGRGGMGWRPPPSRGQGFDARTREGRDGLAGSWGQRDGAHSGSRGEDLDARVAEERGMGFCMREDTEGGWVPA